MPTGKIIDFTFPTSTEVNKKENWRLTFTNTGDRGRVYAGIGNLQDNPNNLIIIYKGKNYVLPPGYIFYLYAEIDPGQYIADEGQVMFITEGNYMVRIEAGHLVGDRIEPDHIENILVEVRKPAAPPPEAPAPPTPGVPPGLTTPMWISIGLDAIGLAISIIGLALMLKRR